MACRTRTTLCGIPGFVAVGVTALGLAALPSGRVAAAPAVRVPLDLVASIPPRDASAPCDTRGRILEAAARCFARKGFVHSSQDEVAAEAGVTKGALYWHFASKNDLFFALLDARCAKMDQHLTSAMASSMAAGDPKAALVTLMSAVVNRLATDPEWPRLFIEFFGQTLCELCIFLAFNLKTSRLCFKIRCVISFVWIRTTTIEFENPLRNVVQEVSIVSNRYDRAWVLI